MVGTGRQQDVVGGGRLQEPAGEQPQRGHRLHRRLGRHRQAAGPQLAGERAQLADPLRRHRQQRPRQRPHPLERAAAPPGRAARAARPRRRGRGPRAGCAASSKAVDDLRVELDAGHRRLLGTRPIRSRPGARSAARRNVSPGGSGGAQAGSPSTGPAIASSIAAASRTVRASGPLVPRPVTSPPSGALLTRPRLGLMPTSPLMLAGMRIEPPPSLPCANGTIPAATATAAPPLDPPAEQGRVPRAAGRAGEVVVGVAGEAELRGVGLAEADRPGGGERGDDGVVHGRHEVGHHPRSRTSSGRRRCC